MQQETLKKDSVNIRPLPKWLTDQKEGLTKTQTQPPAMSVKKDPSLGFSLAATGLFILLAVAILTIFVVRKYKNKAP